MDDAASWLHMIIYIYMTITIKVKYISYSEWVCFKSVFRPLSLDECEVFQLFWDGCVNVTLWSYSQFGGLQVKREKRGVRATKMCEWANIEGKYIDGMVYG